MRDDEMREMLIEVLDAIDHPDHGDGISLATYNKARALLTRSEAAPSAKVPESRYIDCPCCSSHEEHRDQCTPHSVALEKK